MGTDQGYGAFNVLHQSTVRTGDRPDLAGVLFNAEIDPYAIGIGEGPAVKRSAAYDVDPLRGQLRTGPVVTVAAGPELAGERVQIDSDGIAQAGRVDATAAAVGVELKYGGALWIVLATYVAARADGSRRADKACRLLRRRPASASRVRTDAP